MRARLVWIVLFASAATAGCSDNNDANKPPDSGVADSAAADGSGIDDGTTAKDQPAPTDGAAPKDQSGPDAIEADSATLPTVSEQEPNNGATDTEFNAITLPTEVTGAIGEANDIDLFRFTASAGDRLVLKLKSGADLQPHLAIFGEPPLDVPVVVSKGPGDVLAELYLIKDGNYLVGVRDQRNVGDPPAGMGGPTFTYSLAIEPLARPPLPATVGGSVDSTLDPPGTVRVFSFAATEGDDLSIQVIAQKLAQPSDVDSRLSLFFPAQGTWLGTNDNPTMTEHDSVLQGEMPFSGTYHAIVENVADSSSDHRFTLEITKTN